MQKRAQVLTFVTIAVIVFALSFGTFIYLEKKSIVQFDPPSGYGYLKVTKITKPADDPQSFKFSLPIGGDPNEFNLAHGEFKLFTLSPGTYQITEAGQEGWVSNSICSKGGKPIEGIQISDGDSIVCTFLNTKAPPQPPSGGGGSGGSTPPKEPSCKDKFSATPRTADCFGTGFAEYDPSKISCPSGQTATNIQCSSDCKLTYDCKAPPPYIPSCWCECDTELVTSVVEAMAFAQAAGSHGYYGPGARETIRKTCEFTDGLKEALDGCTKGGQAITSLGQHGADVQSLCNQPVGNNDQLKKKIQELERQYNRIISDDPESKKAEAMKNMLDFLKSLLGESALKYVCEGDPGASRPSSAGGTSSSQSGSQEACVQGSSNTKCGKKTSGKEPSKDKNVKGLKVNKLAPVEGGFQSCPN